MTDEALTAADDQFHPPSDDPWWTETVWFSWMIPERELLGQFYPVFRPNLGVQFGGVVVFGPEQPTHLEEQIYHYDQHQPLAPDLDLTDFTLAGGLRLKVLEPTRKWHVGYSGRHYELDVVAEAVNRPLVTRRSTPPLGGGHIDQLCKVTGSITLHGEHLEIDCLAIRDRAWQIRPDGRQPRVFYCYGAASEGHSFLAAGVHRDGVDTITTGWYERDGGWARLVSGRRDTVRGPDGQVAELVIDGHDELGRHLHAPGTTRSRHLYQGYPAMICWLGLADYDLDGEHAIGEDQDVFSPRGWRDHRGVYRTGS
jgi:hypothetical protein